MSFELTEFDVGKYDEILSLGLSAGLGAPDGQMCIEAAICRVLGLDHSDNPPCVARSVRSYKIGINDSPRWSSPHARAKGLRDLGLAQLGSLGVVDDREFTGRMAEKTIKILIPKLFRFLPLATTGMFAAADRCEADGAAATESARRAAMAAACGASATESASATCSAIAAAKAARAAAEATESASATCSAAKAAAKAVAAAAEAAEAAAAAEAAEAAAGATWAAAAAAKAAKEAAEAAEAEGATWAVAAAASAAAEAAKADGGEEYLLLSVSLALETLRELGSPGIALLSSSTEGDK